MQGGLNVDTPVGVGQTQVEQIEEQWSTFDEVELQLARMMGIYPPEQPQCHLPKVTARILTDANNREFTQIYANFGEWFGYVTATYGRIQAKLLELNEMLTRLEVQNRKNMLEAWRRAGGTKKEKPTIQEMSDYNTLHPLVQKVRLEWQKTEQERLILQPRKEQLYRDLKIISRQVEIRGQEIERNRITNNMPSRQHIPRGGPYG